MSNENLITDPMDMCMESGFEDESTDGDQDGKDGEKQSAHSFGTGSFTTNTFNARLAGSHGMQILKYVQSEHFGKHGESIKLVANINVSFASSIPLPLLTLLTCPCRNS